MRRGGAPTIGHCPVSIGSHLGRHNIAAADMNVTFVKFFQKLKLVCKSNVAHSFVSFVGTVTIEPTTSFLSEWCRTKQTTVYIPLGWLVDR